MINITKKEKLIKLQEKVLREALEMGREIRKLKKINSQGENHGV